MKVQELKAKNTFTLNFLLQALIYGAVQNADCGLTADYSVSRIRKQWDYRCHLLICMVNIIGDELLLNFGAKFQP